MTIVAHDDLEIHAVPRIRTRVLVAANRGAKETAVWEQWIDEGGCIPLHYHEVEEVLVFLAGEITLTEAGQSTTIRAPATAVIPPKQIHGLRPTGRESVHLMAFFPTAQPKIIRPDGTLRPMPWEDYAVGEAPS